MKIYSLFVVIIIQLNTLWAIHPNHLSVTNLSINEKEKSIDYSIRLFQDDINYLISALYHEELYHSTDTFDFDKSTEKIDNYFLNAFQIFSEGNQYLPKIVNRVNNEHEYWLHYSIKLNEIPKNLTIKNRILLDIYADQTNLVIISYSNQEKGISFNLEKQEHYINLETVKSTACLN